MTTENPLVVKIKLRPKINAIPDDGLTVSRLRVELAIEEKPDEAWIAEINVLGDLPWRTGEERVAELRIMSNYFRNYVMLENPVLLVKRGSEVIGNLELENRKQ